MKKIFFIVFFTFLQSSVNSNDIENLQIEQISIGDSLLDYYSKKQIDKRSSHIKLGKKKFKEYKKFYKDKNNELYDRVVLYFKSDDIKYIVKQISGRKYFINQIDNCYKTQNIISTHSFQPLHQHSQPRLKTIRWLQNLGRVLSVLFGEQSVQAILENLIHRMIRRRRLRRRLHHLQLINIILNKLNL